MAGRNLFANEPASAGSNWSFENLAESAGRGMTNRGIGIIQTGMEAVGATDNDFYRQSLETAARLRREGEDTGVVGLAGEIAGDPLTYLLAGPAKAAGSLPALAGYGAASGVVAGGTAPIAEGEDRMLNMLMSGGIGVAAAPAAGYVAGKVGRAIEYPVNKTKDAVGSIQQALGKVGGDDLVGLEISVGQSYDDFANALAGMSDDAIAAFKQASKAGLSPRQAYLVAKAKEEGITLTRGMLTQEPAQQRLEDMAAQGVLNQRAYQIADQTGKSNAAALREYGGKLLDDVGGNLVDETSVADAVARGVKSKAAALKAPANAAFEAGKATSARVSGEQFQGFHRALRDDLVEEGFDIGAMPSVSRNLDTIKRSEKVLARRGEIKYKPLEVFRKRLYKAYSSASDPSEKEAMRRIYGKYTDKLDDIITNGLLKNPDEAAAQLREAPALWRTYKQAIYGKDGKAALGKIVDYDMTDRQVADLFGSNLAGRGDTQKVVAQLKNVLGEDSPEFGQVRGMFLNRLFKGALGDKSDDVAQKGFGTRLASDLRTMKTKNQALYDELFTPDMRKEIENFADISYLMSATNRSKVNPSGSGIVAADLMGGILKRLGAHGSIGAIAEIAGKELALRGSSKQAIQSLAEPLKRIGSDTRIISDALRQAGAVAGAKSGQPPIIDGMSSPTRITVNPAMQGREGVPDVELPEGRVLFQEEPVTPGPQSALPESIESDEGLSLASYDDTEGYRTVGRGFNMDNPIAPKIWKKAGIKTPFDSVKSGDMEITEEDADKLAVISHDIAVRDIKSLLPEFDKLSPARQEALVNLSYQLGKPKLQKFGSTLAAIKRGDFKQAHDLLKDSKYARQTPERAVRVAEAILNG